MTGLLEVCKVRSYARALMPFAANTTATQGYANDVMTGQCTLWNLPLHDSFSFLDKPNASGFRVLDNLVQPYVIAQQFIAALDMLRGAFVGSYISLDCYKQVLLTHPRPGYSLLHELIMTGDVSKFDGYLNAIETMYQEQLINIEEYKNIFFTLNTGGYRATHQAVNAPNVAIADHFLNWIKHTSTLSAQDRREIVNASSHTLSEMKPRRDPRKYCDASRVNSALTDLRHALHLDIPLVRHEQRFFSALSVDVASPISTVVSSEADASPGWSPWDSPVVPVASIISDLRPA